MQFYVTWSLVTCEMSSEHLALVSFCGQAFGSIIEATGWSAPLKRMRVLYEGSHKEIIDDQKAKTTKA